MDTVFTQGSPEDRLALLDALYEQAPVGLAFVDGQLRYQRINATLAAINGHPVDAHIGRTVAEMLGEIGAGLEAAMRRVLESRAPSGSIDVEGETAAAPGERRWWRLNLYPVADADGRVRGVGAVVVETTAERRAAAEAEATLALLDVVFDTAPVGMAFWDRDLRYVRINDAGTEVNGLTRDEHLGRHVDEVMTGAFGERIVALLREVLRTGEPVLGLELSGERPGRPGEQHHREVSYYPLPGPDGTVVGVGAVVQDVSARRRLDELRQRLLDREHQARLDAEAARRRAEIIAASGDALAASLDWEQTVTTAARVAVPAFADFAVLHLLDPSGRLSVAGLAHRDPAHADLMRELSERFGPRLSLAQGVGEAMRTGRSVATFELDDAMLARVATAPEHGEGLRTLGPRSVMVVPVTAGARRLGALLLGQTSSGRRFGEEDVLLAEALSDRIALALENARLHTERSKIAQTLQQSLLPPALPTLPGIEAAAGYLPAGEANDVGGDFYDLFESEPGLWTVLVGDVAGKGAEAAALTSLARYTLRTASMLDSSPVHNLQLLNEVLLDRDAGTCTVLYARLAPQTGRVRMVATAAGHPPPLALRAAGGIDELTPPGTLLGAVDSPRLRSTESLLEPGDVVLFYTDGATDVRVGGGVLGDGALRAELAGCAGCTAAEVVERVAGRIRESQGGHLDDDLALLALRVAPEMSAAA
jgi:PAS domain S-box-containing protein